MDARELILHLGVWPTGPDPLQHKLTRGLVDAIRKGAVHPGIRLPSERSLAQALSISRTTVVAAYDALRESKWLESRTGSGTWVCESSPAVAAARGAEHARALDREPAPRPGFSIVRPGSPAATFRPNSLRCRRFISPLFNRSKEHILIER